MATANTVTIVGNATRDPELRFTQSGKAVANFGLAISHRWYNQQTQNWDEQDPEFFDVTVWGDMAENVAQTILKGARVMVMGRLSQHSWDDKDTGAKRSKVEIMADEVAPSLRWATAEVKRTEKKEGSGGGGDNGGGGRGNGGSSRGNSGGGRGNDRAASRDYSDEPF